MAIFNHVVFSSALIAASLSVVTFSLLYVFMSLSQLSTLLDFLGSADPSSPANAVRQLLASVVHALIGGETPLFLNQSAFAAAALLVCLVVLLIYVEEALLRVKEKVRAWGKLPSVEVLHHYNNNSYDAAIAKVGKGLQKQRKA